MKNPDVIIIGSGVAGVSVAFPLVESGLRVCMLDFGNHDPDQNYLEDSIYNLRKNGSDYSYYVLGNNFEGIGGKQNETPKMKVPQYKYVRKDFLEEYSIKPKNINPTGSLSMGGLSNMWGAGVFPYIDEDLQGSFLYYNDLKISYESIARRIGISGANDDMAKSFGKDIPLLDPIELHQNARSLLNRYSNREKRENETFILGYNRNAVISKDYDGRNACSLENSCLWGCKNESIYSATIDLDKLKKYDNFKYVSGVFVKKLKKNKNGYDIIQKKGDSYTSLFSKRICLAAGTIGSTIIACSSLNIYNHKLKILCHPAFAFPLIFPGRIGSPISEKNFSLGQLAYSIHFNESESAFGILFSSEGILSSDIASYMPSSSPTSSFVAKMINPAILLANCYLPGSYSDCDISISDNKQNFVSINGNYIDSFHNSLKNTYKKLSRRFRKYGAYTIPGTLKISNLGSDGHFVGSIPMLKENYENKVLCSDQNGQIRGLDNVYVVDGSSLPILSPKHPTFTIMANADRIGRYISKDIKF